MAVLAPITLKGTRSMLAMQKLQPEMKRIQEAHKGDRQAANEAMMAFYKEHKINPLSGCLPMSAAVPGADRDVPGHQRPREKQDRRRVRIGTPSYLSHDSALFEALQKSGGKMKSFGVDFGATPANAGRGAIVLYMLIGLVTLTSYYQVRQMTSRNTQINPQMQMMNRITPLFSGLISISLPGGVTLYFLVSNLFRITQQSLMYRFDPHSAGARRRGARGQEQGRLPATRAQEGSFRQHPRTSGELASRRVATATAGAQSRPNGSSSPSGPKPTSGRVTQPGRQNNASRKRSKKRR